jgi:hypothetical protein
MQIALNVEKNKELEISTLIEYTHNQWEEQERK